MCFWRQAYRFALAGARDCQCSGARNLCRAVAADGASATKTQGWKSEETGLNVKVLGNRRAGVRVPFARRDRSVIWRFRARTLSWFAGVVFSVIWCSVSRTF